MTIQINVTSMANEAQPVEKEDAQNNRQLLWLLAGLYLVQGIPVGLAFQAFPALLRHAGASLDLVAMVPLAAMPWVLKFFWAPLVENHWLDRWGRRRSWFIPLQLLCALTLGMMAIIPLDAHAAMPLLVLIGILALLSSTQDIVTDGLATERLNGAALGRANILQVGCFMLGMLVGGALVMIAVEQLGYAPTFVALAILQLICLVPVLRWREPAPSEVQIAVPARLILFFKRPYLLIMLVLTMCATMGGSILFSLSKLVLLDAGWSMTDVGVISGVGNSFMVILGCLMVIPLVNRMSPWSVLLLGLALLMISSCSWTLLQYRQMLTPPLVWAVVLFTGLAIGINAVASYTLMMQFARAGCQPGTDVAGFQATQAFGDIVMAIVGVMLASSLGYQWALLLAVPVAFCCLVFVLIGQDRIQIAELSAL
jgi:RhtX/FptX family siderophore transporter